MARALARRLAARGTDLVLTARVPSDLDDLVAELEAARGGMAAEAAERGPTAEAAVPEAAVPGATVEVVALDLLEIDEAEARIGRLDPVPDLVVVFSGVMEPGQGERPSPQEVERVLRVNLLGCARVLEAAGEMLEARGSGTLVGVSSVAGDRGRWANYLYGASKAGLTAYLSGLRAHLAPKDVRVLTVKPGLIRTRMTAHRDHPPLLAGEPDQVARAIVRAVRQRRNVIYVPWFWRWIMLAVRVLPEPLFKRLRF